MVCVLCNSEFISTIHWTDQNSVGNKGENTPQRIRNHRVQICNSIFRQFGLTLEDWNGTKYILRDLKGNSEIIHDLGTLWLNVEKLLGKPIDPLHPEVLEKIDNHNHI